MKIEGNNSQIRVIRLWGKNIKSGQWERLDASAFLSPIPVHFLRYIYKNQFGLLPRPPKVIKIRFTDLRFEIPYQTPSDEDITSAKRWFKQRLDHLGYLSLYFKTTEETLTINHKLNKVTSTVTENEKIYKLN